MLDDAPIHQLNTQVYVRTREKRENQYLKHRFKPCIVQSNVYLAARRNTNRTWPIVVQEAKFIGESLQNIRFEVRLVVQDDVVRGSHSALTHALWHQEEIEQMTTSDGVIEDSEYYTFSLRR